MSTYVPTRHKLWTPLDDQGGRSFSMIRYDHESLGDFRARLLLEARDPAGPTEQQFVRSVSRQVALQDIPVFKIHLVLDAQDQPVAPDARVEVTSTRVRAYSDYSGGTVSVEVNLLDREDGLLLEDVYAAFEGNAYFTLDILDQDYASRLSRYLRYGSTQGFRRSHLLLETRENSLPDSNIEALYPERSPYFQTEVETLEGLLESGQFYVDYTSGTLFTHDPPVGTISYSYKDFPWVVYWSSCRAWPLNDPDKVYAFKDIVIGDDTGTESHEVPGDVETKIFNELLALHPLTWGE